MRLKHQAAILTRAAFLASALLLAAAVHSSALVLDWTTAAWTPGDLTNSYDLNGDGVSDITVAATSQQPGIWATDPTSGSQAPVVNQTLTGGLTPVQRSLMLAANLHTNSNATLQISFTGGNGALNQSGANNVSFTIFDIDVTTNSDIVSNIYGVLPNGTHVPATITNVGPATTLGGSGLTQVLTGNVAAANDTGAGNVTISFGSTLITDVFFTFGNTAGAPFYQDIGLSNISFTPVPEMNPAIFSGLSCICAVVITIWLRRRRAFAHRVLRP